MRRRKVTSMLVLLGTGSMAQQREQRERRPESMAKLYSECRTAHERLLFCIAAIDDATIDVQVRLEKVKALFGGDFSDLGAVGTSGLDFAAMVNFEKLPEDPGANPKEARMVKGWYLYLKYDRAGLVRDYWLSDVRKGMPKRG
jgi:hypothetical protein